MLTTLADWRTRCADVIAAVEAQVAHIQAAAEERRARQRVRAARVEQAVQAVNEDTNGGNGSGSGSGGWRGLGGAGLKRSLHSAGDDRKAGSRAFFGSGSGGKEKGYGDGNESGSGGGNGQNMTGAGGDRSGMELDDDSGGTENAAKYAKRSVAT